VVGDKNLAKILEDHEIWVRDEGGAAGGLAGASQ
jgi:hypothetical protein